MILQERDIDVLRALATYHVLTTHQIRALCFPADKSGRISRRRLLNMGREDYVKKRTMRVVNPTDGSATPVFHLGRRGRETLAGRFDDDRFLRKPIEILQPQHLFHYVAVSETQMLLRSAISRQSDIRLDDWFNEDEVVNTDETDHSKYFRLFTELTETPKLVCAPDSGFLIDFEGQRAAFYLEQDRDSYFHKRVAAQKSPGYEALLSRRLHRKHFPSTTLDHFFVLVVAPSKKRRDQLRAAFAETNKNKSVERIYRFLSLDEANPENLLTESILRCCHRDDFVPMVKQQETESPTATQPQSSAIALPSGS